MVHVDKFEAWLDGELLCTSRQPRLDGARVLLERVLLERGYPTDTLMTTRAHGRDYDSFHPAPLGELAKWTVTERDRTGLRRESWRSYQDGVSRSAVDSRMRKSPLRGARVPEQVDDAVSPDLTGATAHPNAA